MFVRAALAGALLYASGADAFSPSALPALNLRSHGALQTSLQGKVPRSEAALGGLMMARKPFIAGNWKMNPKTLEEADSLAKAVVKEAATSPAEVLIGHSERRALFGASDELINKQVHKALADGLKPLLCIGETKDEYEAGLNTIVCATQLSKGLKGVTKEQMKQITIAYEPVWAIGTGLVCDAGIAQGVHKFIRSWIEKMFDIETADDIRIQYGGSVTPDSVDELLSKPDIDGCLVGGASLDPAKFARIMNFKVSDAKNPLGGEAGGLRDKLWTALTGAK